MAKARRFQERTMAKQSKARKAEAAPAEAQQPDAIRFDSGRAVRRAAREGGEWIEVVETNGQVVLSVELTEKGPRIVLEGATLALKATESISLEAKHVAIKAEETAVLESAGALSVSSVQEMKVHADDDVRVTGKIIWLN
jgi:hypothetical protein